MGTLLGQKDGTFSGNEQRSSIFRKRKRKYSLTFDVLADSVDEKWTEVLNTPGLPRPLEDFQGDGCRCKNRSPKEAKTVMQDGVLTILWTVQCDFDSEVVFKDIGKEQEQMADPLEWPTTIAIHEHEETRDLLNAWNAPKTPVCNPNGERIHVEVTQSYPLIEFSRYEAYPDSPSGVAAFLKKMANFANTLNNTEFMGFPKYSCLMMAPTATREEINGGRYFKVTYRILIKNYTDEEKEASGQEDFSPFDVRPLCEGYLVRDRETDEIRSTSELYGQNIKVNLDANGCELGEGEDPHFLYFHTREGANFNELNLIPEDWKS